MSNWIDTLSQKKSELELIASWASIVNLGTVRDACRTAIYEIKLEIDRQKELNNASRIDKSQAARSE